MVRVALLAAVFAAALPLAAGAQPVVATPKPGSPVVKRTLPPPQFPNTALHAVYTVETNKLGQVTRIRSVQASKNSGYDAITYGNAIQTFIRKDDGTAVAGVYDLVYDYNPKTHGIHRDVRMVQRGGVNENAIGAVLVEAQKAKDRQKRDEERLKEAAPQVKPLTTSSPSKG